MLSIRDLQEQKDELIQLTKLATQIESPSTNKAAVDRMGKFVSDHLRALGAAITIHETADAGHNVVGRWNAASDEKSILLLFHMDTVWDVGTLAQRPIREEAGKLYGPGAYDMKASIAMAFVVLRMLRERGLWPQRPITALFTSDEETGSHSSRALIEHYAREAAVALVVEPALADGSLKTARKGTGIIEIQTRGRAAHAGVDHAKGRNAIEELAHHILAAQKLTDYDKGTTANTGLVRGGTRTNVVPDEAQAIVDIRVAHPTEVQRLEAWARSRQPVLEGTRIEARLVLNRPPMPRDETMIASFRRAHEIGCRLGLDLTEGSTGGGSDGNFVAALGVPVLDGLGAVGDGAHAEHEHVLVESLPERAALLGALITEWR